MLRKNHAKTGLTAKDPSVPDGFLHIQGRELGSELFALEFDDEGLKWAITREAEVADMTQNPNFLLIADAVNEATMGPTELSEATKINLATIKTCLTRMVKKEILIKVSKGKYGLVGVNYGGVVG